MKIINQSLKLQSKSLLSLIAVLALTVTSSVRAETTECNEITSIPTVLTDQGVYCLKGDLATNITSGNAIEIQTNNVTIDFNGFKLGGLEAGKGTQAYGVYALERKNITLRNGNIRGFHYGILLQGTTGGGHVIEDNRLNGNPYVGMRVDGISNIIRRNQVNTTSGSTVSNFAYGIYSVGPGVEIVDNKVDSTASQSTGTSYAVSVHSGDAAIVLNNRISRTEHSGTGSSIAIEHGSGDRVLIQGNAIVNSGQQGTTAIRGDDGVECISRNNTIVNFDNTITDCSTSGDLIRP